MAAETICGGNDDSENVGLGGGGEGSDVIVISGLFDRQAQRGGGGASGAEGGMVRD